MKDVATMDLMSHSIVNVRFDIDAFILYQHIMLGASIAFLYRLQNLK